MRDDLECGAATADGELTAALRALKRADPAAAEDAARRLERALHRLARMLMAGERRDHTLQPTALVNEAFLRLAGQRVDWVNRGHFLATAATMMRRVLSDHARGRGYQKRGAAARAVCLEDLDVLGVERGAELVALDDALSDLAALSPRLASIVELRYFFGLSGEEIALALGLSSATVTRDWRAARAWLLRYLGTRHGACG
jgi:RNA polymerase sigma factor (TIGR02999 family)